MGEYILDGKDLRKIFGLVISSGSGTFLEFPKRKESLRNDFNDYNGVNMDLSNPKFEGREFKLQCNLIANGKTDFWEKYNALFTELAKSEVRLLYIKDLGREFKVYYLGQENLQKITQLDNVRVGIKFDLVFGELDPFTNIDVVYLIDENDRILTA